MVLGFISRGMRSKKMHELEHMLAYNIKRTPQKIREELRSLLHDVLLMKVKRVYKEEFIYTPKKIERSQSCPDLSIYRNTDSPMFRRKRAFSESVQRIQGFHRIQSETELDKIDKERTFQPTDALMEQSDLLLRVVNALGSYQHVDSRSDSETEGGIDCFSDSDILASEKFGSAWTISSQKYTKMPQMRKRACSEIKFPFPEATEKANNLTWYGPAATRKFLEMREKVLGVRPRSRTLSMQPASSSSLLSRIRNTFKTTRDDKNKNLDIERQDYISHTPKGRASKEKLDQENYLKKTSIGRSSLFTSSEDRSPKVPKIRKYSVFASPDPVLENTSIADLFRALTAISVPEAVNAVPRRKLGTASLTPPNQISPPRNRRLPIRPNLQLRRSSLMPPTPTNDNTNRRLSLRPSPPLTESSDFLTPPPYISFSSNPRRSIRAPGSNRRYSLRPVPNISTTPSPVQRQIMKTKEKDDLES